MRNLLLVAFFAGLNSLSIFAQNSSTAESSAAPNSSINWENFELEMTDIDADWTIHTNMEQKTVYIDFKALGGNMSKLALINKANMETIMMDDRLYDLPTNTIYEISLAKLTKGTYSLELHTYNSVIKEEINIQ